MSVLRWLWWRWGPTLFLALKYKNRSPTAPGLSLWYPPPNPYQGTHPSVNQQIGAHDDYLIWTFARNQPDEVSEVRSNRHRDVWEWKKIVFSFEAHSWTDALWSPLLTFIVALLIRSNIPNRSTFVCPFCGARNLDQQELVKHCMDNHRNDPNKVVRNKSAALNVLFTCRKAFNPETNGEICHRATASSTATLSSTDNKQNPLLHGSLTCNLT